jgi:hypothetical protein
MELVRNLKAVNPLILYLLEVVVLALVEKILGLVQLHHSISLKIWQMVSLSNALRSVMEVTERGLKLFRVS